jgi:hypothetical protein
VVAEVDLLADQPEPAEPLQLPVECLPPGLGVHHVHRVDHHAHRTIGPPISRRRSVWSPFRKDER